MKQSVTFEDAVEKLAKAAGAGFWNYEMGGGTMHGLSVAVEAGMLAKIFDLSRSERQALEERMYEMAQEEYRNQW